MNPFRFGLVPTFQDNFTSYADTTAGDAAWVTTDTGVVRVNPTTDVLDWIWHRDGTNDTITHDLVTPLSDTIWLLRYKLHSGTLFTSTLSFAGMSSTTGGSNATQDFIGERIETDATNYKLTSRDTDGATIQAAGGDNVTNITRANDVDRWHEKRRLTSTTYEIEVFSDAYITSQGTSAGTCASTTVGLQYIKFTNIETNPVAGSTTCYVDDVYVYDGISSL